MKVIDLLNKIANGEEVPKKIKYEGIEYTHIDNYCYADKNSRLLSYEIYAEQHRLNDEIEIIEDYKAPEIPYGYCQVLDGEIKKFDIRTDSISTEYVVGKRFGKAFGKAFVDYAEKINEIIDVVNQLKKQPPIININGPQSPFMKEPYKITCSASGKESDK